MSRPPGGKAEARLRAPPIFNGLRITPLCRRSTPYLTPRPLSLMGEGVLSLPLSRAPPPPPTPSPCRERGRPTGLLPPPPDRGRGRGRGREVASAPWSGHLRYPVPSDPMPIAAVTRRAHFNAAHRLHNPRQSDEWNVKTF